MKNLKTIMLFVLIVTTGVFVIDHSLSASTKDCWCIDGNEAAGECMAACWDLYGAECVNIVLIDHGCYYEDCDSFWKFYCDNGAKGYFTTTWEYCWNCEI